MSGTLASIRKKKKLEEETRKNVIKQINHKNELKINREEIISEICKTFGWNELDDFAKKMIEEAFSNKFVDIKKLKKDLADWKESKEQR